MRTAFAAAALVFTIGAAAAEDNRIVLDLTPEVKAQFLEHMRTHMTSLNDVIQLMAAGKIREAGAVARSEMAIGKGTGIGRFMPPEFREMGFDFHRSADDFARVTADMAEPTDAASWAKAAEGLAQITARCTACHATFRVK
jgi:cytochrome c556